MARRLLALRLPRRLSETPELRFLVVAEKYQTGFDEPTLCTMYVDRKFSGLRAVQTLSRLNRTHRRFPNKRTFVLDFQNSKEEIREASCPYFEATELEEVTDPNQIYEIYERLFTFGIIDKNEVDRFAEIYFKGPLQPADRPRLEGLVWQAVERFQTLDDESEQEEFRQLLRSYQRFYSFTAQVVTLEDPNLEKMYEYASWLSRLLPNRDIPEQIEITDDMLRLQAFRVQESGGLYNASLQPGGLAPER